MNDAESMAVYSLVLIVILYYGYYFTAFSNNTPKWFKKIYFENHATYLFLFQKLSGFLMLGPIAALLFYPFFQPNWKKTYLHIDVNISIFILLTILIPLIVILIYFSSKNKDIFKRIPHMRHKKWDFKKIFTSITGWGLYLLGYEFIFRKLLLFSWTEAYGILTAVVVNTAVYSAFHLPNGRKETLASLFFGVVLCLISLQTGSFIPAFILHFTLSASTEMFSIYHNPEMEFSFSKH